MERQGGITMEHGNGGHGRRRADNQDRRTEQENEERPFHQRITETSHPISLPNASIGRVSRV